jgi:tetratricopeptide (TPR) repeat protein
MHRLKIMLVCVCAITMATTLYAGESAVMAHTREHHVAGQIAFTEGNYDRAVHEFRKAVHEHPDSSSDWLWLARALGRKAENSNPMHAAFMVGDIRRAFEKSVELDPKNLEARADLLEFYMEAPSAFGGGMDKARDQADAIGRLNKGDGLLALSRIAEKDEKFAVAERQLKTAIEIDPSSARYLELGGYYHRRKNYPAMEEALRKSSDPKAGYELGVALLEQGQRLPEAERLASKFIATGNPAPGDEPTLAQARVLLGKIQARQGRRQEAAREFRSALQENPNLKDAKKELEKVE